MNFVLFSCLDIIVSVIYFYIYAPFEKGGHIALNIPVRLSVGRSVPRSVSMSVSLNIVQLITQERFASDASNLIGR